MLNRLFKVEINCLQGIFYIFACYVRLEFRWMLRCTLSVLELRLTSIHWQTCHGVISSRVSWIFVLMWRVWARCGPTCILLVLEWCPVTRNCFEDHLLIYCHNLDCCLKDAVWIRAFASMISCTSQSSVGRRLLTQTPEVKRRIFKPWSWLWCKLRGHDVLYIGVLCIFLVLRVFSEAACPWDWRCSRMSNICCKCRLCSMVVELGGCLDSTKLNELSQWGSWTAQCTSFCVTSHEFRICDAAQSCNDVVVQSLLYCIPLPPSFWRWYTITVRCSDSQRKQTTSQNLLTNWVRLSAARSCGYSIWHDSVAIWMWQEVKRACP